MPVRQEEKIGIIHKYLEENFPQCSIRVGYDFKRMSPKFTVLGKSEKYCAIINQAFIKKRGKKAINAWLKTSILPQKLSDHVNRSIIVSPQGNFSVE